MDLKKDNRSKHKKHKNFAPPHESSHEIMPSTTNSEVLKISEDPNAKFSKRKLINNREKYEVEIEDEENEQMLAANFSNLQMNRTIGGHFQFSSEKKWETELEEVSNPFQDNFSLNISLLADGLSTIPFYERHDYNISLFTEKDVKKMDLEALANTKRYKKIAEEHIAKNYKIVLKQPDHVKTKMTSKDSSLELQKLHKKMESRILSDPTDDVSKIIPIVPEISNSITEDSSKSVNEDSKEDIQKWLDDVLND